MRKTIFYWEKIYDKAQMGAKMMEEILVVKDLHVSYSDGMAGFWVREKGMEFLKGISFYIDVVEVFVLV